MDSRPLLSDLPSHKFKPRPGDRVIARVSFDLSRDQYLKISRGIDKFVGAEVNLLIVNCLRTNITWKKVGETEVVVLSEAKSVHSDLSAQVVNLDCTVVDLRPGDILFVQHLGLDCELRLKEVRAWIQKWAGEDVEVVVQRKES